MADYKSARLAGMKQFGFGPDAMKQTKVCQVCCHSCDAHEKVCPMCGAALPRHTLFDLYKSFHLYCGDCGTVVSSNARFCPECGKGLGRQRTLYNLRHAGRTEHPTKK